MFERKKTLFKGETGIRTNEIGLMIKTEIRLMEIEIFILSAALELMERVGGNRSKERDRKSQLVLRSTYQIFEWDRNNSDRNFYNVVRYVNISLVP